MINWLKIIVYVLMLILEGLSKNEAVAKGAESFGVSVEEILKHL